MFISSADGGKATDCQLVVQSGFLHHLEEGDVVLCDKGFPSIVADARNKVIMHKFTIY